MHQTARLAGVGLLGAALLLSPAPAPAQFVDAHFEPVPTVPDPGTYPETVQQAIEEGYRQLAAVTDPSDDVHLDAAEAAFERALAADPRSIHALNGMGLYELAKDEQWLVILESLKKLFNRDHISMAIKQFERALEIDPGFHAARYNLALAHRQARGEESYEKAIAELERLVAEAPTFADAPLLLAMTYRDAGDLEAMAGAVESAPEGDAFPVSTRQLLLAYALFNTEQPEAGAAAYWQGVGAIATGREADLFWHDIRPIVSPEAEAAFEALDVDGKRARLREFWQQIADQSFVTVDDRLAEHYRRLQYASRNYRLDIPERRHYSSMAAYVPPWQTGFDDRGVIYLRHGEPDDVATYSAPEFEKNVSWKYEQPDGDPLIFHFVADEDVRDFKLVRRLSDAVITGSSKLSGQTTFNRTCGVGGRCDSYDIRILASDLEAIRDLYSSRGHLDPYYDLAATGLDQQTLEDEEINLAEDIAVGTESQSYRPELPGTPLPAPVHAVAFKNPDGRPGVSFYYAVPTSEITVLPHASGGSSIDYRYQLLVNDPSADIVARQEDDVAIASARPIPRDAGVMLPGVRSVSVDPGRYEYGMKVTDLNSGRTGLARGSVRVDDFTGGALSMSGIVLASRIEPADDPSNPFVRWSELKVLPLPSRVFRREQPVFVYYEVYGLTPRAGGGARYRTTYTLSALEPDRNVVVRFFSAIGELLSGEEERGAITYSFERSQSGRVDPLLEYFSIDVSESEPGDYRLTVEVEDLESGATTTREVSLTLVG